MFDPAIDQLTPKDAAAYLGLSHHTLSGWRRRKIGPCYSRALGRILYRMEDLEAFKAHTENQGYVKTGPLV